MTKKKVMGRDLFTSPSSSYKRELLDLGDKSVWVRELSAKAMLEYKEAGDVLESEYSQDKNVVKAVDVGLEITSRLVIQCLCDEQGELIATEADIPNIKQLPNAMLNKIVAKALELSGVDVEKMVEVAANLKNEGIDT